MNTATIILRIVFLASAFASSLFSLGSVLPGVVHSEYSQHLAAALSLVIALALCLALIRSGSLASPAVGLRTLLKTFSELLAWSYLKLAGAVCLVFVATLTAVGVSLKDAAALSALFAFWLALCMAPAMASVATGRKLTTLGANGA